MGKGDSKVYFQLQNKQVLGINIQQYYVVYLKVAERVNLESLHHKEKKRFLQLCLMTDVN